MLYSASGIHNCLSVCPAHYYLTRVDYFPLCNVDMTSEEQQRQAMEDFGLDRFELQAVRSTSLKEIKALLVSEHNKVAAIHQETTPRGVCEYAREQIFEACAQESIDFPPKPEEIPRDTAAQIQKFGSLRDSAYYARIVVATLPSAAWNALQVVWQLNARWCLKGQKKPATTTENKPVGIKKIENMCSKLITEDIIMILDRLARRSISLADLDRTVALQFGKRQVEAIFARQLQLKPTMEEFMFEENRNGSFSALQQQFPQLLHDRLVCQTTNHLKDTNKLKKLKMPPKLKTPEKPHSKTAKKQIKAEYERLDPYLKNLVNSLRTQLMLKMQRGIAGRPNAAGAATPAGQLSVICIPKSKSTHYHPMTFTFVVGDICTFTDVTNSAPAESESKDGDRAHSYEAAHVQLPLQKDKLMDGEQIEMLVASIASGTKSPTLVLQLWCPNEQESTCLEAMEKQFDEVRKTYWWSTKAKRAKDANVLEDIRIGFIGFKADSAPIDIATNWRGGHSSVTLAPPVPRKKRSKGLATENKPPPVCNTEMNTLIPMKFFANYSREGSMVADFMCGSGSAAVAAAALGRHCLVMDISQSMVFLLPPITSKPFVFITCCAIPPVE